MPPFFVILVCVIVVATFLDKKNGYDRHGRVLAQSPQLLKVKENLNKPHANYIAHSTKSA